MRITKYLLLPLTMALLTGAAFAQKHTSNAQILAQLQDRLYHARVFQHGEVQVAFEDGVATLCGTVDSVGVKWDAERAVRKADDVVRVVNNVQVSTEDITPRQIVEKARHEILTYYAYGIFDNVVLETQGNKLIVSGQVTQPYKKEDVGNFLAHIKGVAELDNQLEVLPLSQFDDTLRIAIARAIFNDPYFIQYANQPIPPIHIVVKNGSVTLEGVVATQMDKEKAGMDALTAATFFQFTNNLRVEGK